MGAQATASASYSVATRPDGIVAVRVGGMSLADAEALLSSMHDLFVELPPPVRVLVTFDRTARPSSAARRRLRDHFLQLPEGKIALVQPRLLDRLRARGAVAGSLMKLRSFGSEAEAVAWLRL